MDATFSQPSFIDRLLFEDTNASSSSAIPPSKPLNNNSSSTCSAMEYSVRLSAELRNAEEALKRVEMREKSKINLLRQCLIVSLATEPPQALEFILAVCDDDDGLKAHSAEYLQEELRSFKELLHSSTLTRDKQYHLLVDTTERANVLERELAESKLAIEALQRENTAMQNQLQEQSEAFEKQRLQYVTERKHVESEVERQVFAFKAEHEQKQVELESTLQQRLQTESKLWQDRVVMLENALQKEIQSHRREAIDEEIALAVKLQTKTSEEEIRRLRRRIGEMSRSRRTEDEFLALAKTQAQREYVVDSKYELRLKELETKLRESRMDMSAAKFEYLRQCIYSYLTMHSLHQRHTLIPVIAMLLSFTPAERKACERVALENEASEGIFGSISSTVYSLATAAVSPSSNPVMITSSSAAGLKRPNAKLQQYTPVSQTEPKT